LLGNAAGADPNTTESADGGRLNLTVSTVAVAVAVFAVIKEQRATALFPVWLFIAHFPSS
jgi:hypothetical protein